MQDRLAPPYHFGGALRVAGVSSEHAARAIVVHGRGPTHRHPVGHCSVRVHGVFPLDSMGIVRCPRRVPCPPQSMPYAVLPLAVMVAPRGRARGRPGLPRPGRLLLSRRSRSSSSRSGDLRRPSRGLQHAHGMSLPLAGLAIRADQDSTTSPSASIPPRTCEPFANMEWPPSCLMKPKLALFVVKNFTRPIVGTGLDAGSRRGLPSATMRPKDPAEAGSLF